MQGIHYSPMEPFLSSAAIRGLGSTVEGVRLQQANLLPPLCPQPNPWIKTPRAPVRAREACCLRFRPPAVVCGKPGHLISARPLLQTYSSFRQPQHHAYKQAVSDSLVQEDASVPQWFLYSPKKEEGEISSTAYRCTVCAAAVWSPTDYSSHKTSARQRHAQTISLAPMHTHTCTAQSCSSRCFAYSVIWESRDVRNMNWSSRKKDQIVHY